MVYHLKTKERLMVWSSKFTSRDGGPQLALLNKGGGGLLVEGGDGVGQDGDLTLPGGQVSLERDSFALQLLVSSTGGGQGVLGGGELLSEVILGLGEGGLGAGDGGLQ